MTPPLAEVDHCSLSQRVDGKKHSWVFDGDDPYIICAYCDEVRDAITGRVIRNGRPQPNAASVEAERIDP